MDWTTRQSQKKPLTFTKTSIIIDILFHKLVILIKKQFRFSPVLLDHLCPPFDTRTGHQLCPSDRVGQGAPVSSNERLKGQSITDSKTYTLNVKTTWIHFTFHASFGGCKIHFSQYTSSKHRFYCIEYSSWMFPQIYYTRNQHCKLSLSFFYVIVNINLSMYATYYFIYIYMLKENNAKLLAIINNISARFTTNVTNHKV